MRQIFTTFALILAVLPVWTGAVQRTNYACEHQTPVRVRCPAHYVINVKYAFYGRLEKSRCGWNENNHCKAGNSRSIIKQNCQNENSCLLKAENSIFGDPCGGVVKYIKLVYDCVPAAGVIRTSFACEHQTPVRVTCPAHYVIDVKYTFYGRQEKSRCGWNDNNRCKAANSPSIIKRSCQHENSCFLRAENGIFGDPCGGVVKYIKFVYQCVPAAGKKTTCHRL
ncbi:unnamed protein product [Clavelina lepadiformis]|uniref:SUEL-type lectin domain-containing protein n=1 Tax=Clavelina lepadiformis TaxID=159417 RepID=A0ABP0GB03_CLALP